MKAARLYVSGILETSTPSMRMEPESIGNAPAMALSVVDLPAPFEPITVQKSPSSSVNETPRNPPPFIGRAGEESLGDVFEFEHFFFPSCSVHKSGAGAQAGHLFLDERECQRNGDEHGGKELEVVGRHAHFKHECNDESVDDGAENHGGEARLERLRGEEHLADDDGGKADHDRAHAHADVGEAVGLSDGGARESDKAVRDDEAENDHRVGVDALGAGHLRIEAVVRTAVPSSVPKNQ